LLICCETHREQIAPIESACFGIVLHEIARYCREAPVKWWAL
jgi:hypothetical protein